MFRLPGRRSPPSRRLHQASEERSQRDALTKLYNRRRLEDDLKKELARCQRYRRPLSFVMLDVDHSRSSTTPMATRRGTKSSRRSVRCW